MRDRQALLPRERSRYARGVASLRLGWQMMPEAAYQQLLLGILEDLKGDVSSLRNDLKEESRETRSSIKEQGTVLRAEFQAADLKLETNLGLRLSTVETAQERTDRILAEQKGRNALLAGVVSLIASPLVAFLFEVIKK